MPLYKKTTSKVKVKTQNSFISPLLSQMSTQSKIKDLLKDDYDYKENLSIPTKKQLLEPLINISNNDNLLDNLRKKSFKDSSETVIKSSKTKESWSEKDGDGAPALNKKAPKFADLFVDINRNKQSNKAGDVNKASCLENSSKNVAKLRELSRTLSNLSTQSPLLFPPSPHLSSTSLKSNKRFKTDNSMTITTQIAISSNTNEDLFNIKRVNKTSNIQLTGMLNDCVKNNLKMSQQLLSSSDLTEKDSMNTTATSKDIHSLQFTSFATSKDEEDDVIDASLRSLLDEVVSTNIILSQQMKDVDDDIKLTEGESKKKKLKKNKKYRNENKMDEEKADVVNANIILNDKTVADDSLKGDEKTVNKKKLNKEQKKNKDITSKETKTKAKVGLKKASEKSIENTGASSITKQKNKSLYKSKEIDENQELGDHMRVKAKVGLKQASEKFKENIGAPLKSKRKSKQESEEDIKMRAFKKIRVLCSEEDDQMEQPKVSKTDGNKDRLNTNKAKTLGKTLKQNNKYKYLIEKQKETNNKNEKNEKNLSKKREKEVKKISETGSLAQNDKRSGRKKLERTKSFTLTKRPSSPISNNGGNVKKVQMKVSCPPKPKNMIFTSENPKTNELNLKKILELQEERDVGLYVYCDACDKVRFLDRCKDPLELPSLWYCHMNPDPNYNQCSDPNFLIEPEKEELIIHNKYNAGSIVWAKMDGYPWWPAMVDDDPDLIDYFWLDEENGTEPSWYHVTFFDSSEVTRAWIRTANLEPFEINEKSTVFKPKKYDHYRSRVDFAKREAKRACKMDLLERLRTHSFVTRYLKKHNKIGKPPKNRGGSKNLLNKKNTEQISQPYDVNKDGGMTDNNNFGHSISHADSEIISNILLPKKSGKSSIASDDDIIRNIDLSFYL